MSSLEKRVADLERMYSRIPIRQPAGTVNQYFYLTIKSGNLLQTVGGNNYYGLKRPAAAVTTVPTLVPSVVDGACPDGLSPGSLYTSSGSSSTVWVGVRLQPSYWAGAVLTAGTATWDDYSGTLSWLTPFLSRSFAYVPVSGSPGTYATVYNPWAVT